MIKLASEGLVLSLTEQIAHEFYNASLYLYFCGFLKNKGLNGLSKLFDDQYEEERSHGKLIFNLMTDLSLSVRIPEIDGFSEDFNNIEEIANLYFEREFETTESLNAIKNQAIEEGNSVVEEFVREMIKKQQKEYKEATDFYDNALLCGNDWWKCKVWSDSLEG